TNHGSRQELVFGSFFGPSDLTADLGGMSVAVINNCSHSLGKECQRHLSKITGFEETLFTQEYGKGSSPRRGGNYVLEDFPRTIQGKTPASMSSQMNKIYSRNTSQSSSLIAIKDFDKIIAAASSFHRYILHN